jgi:hypothetical protein
VGERSFFSTLRRWAPAISGMARPYLGRIVTPVTFRCAKA